MSTTPDKQEANAARPNALQPSDGLPEIEPLTPELVEDEALRGDFMLRTFVLLLAALLSFTEIAETATLVHVKTGQYLSSHGFWPSGTEVFSFAAEGRPWYNFSWLFDLILAGAYSIGAAKMLTAVKVVLVTLTFFLVTRCIRPAVSTWWGSIAAALALLACHPYFTALPEVCTLLGVALVLWILHRWQASESNRNVLWLLIPLIALWSNLDSRMFLGLSLLVLYAVGDLIGSLVGASGLAQSERRRQLWLVVAACFAAACLNPFGWQALTEPARLYGFEYPAIRDHFAGNSNPIYLQFLPLTETSVLKRPHVVAGLVLMTAAIVTLLLNRRQFDLGHVFMLLGFAGFAMLASHELAVAALVACVVATLNGQDWYRDRFSQSYSVEVKERFFSSGGRAVTVVLMFAVAFLAASGRLNDPAGRRIGWGWHPELQARIDGLTKDLEDALDDRAFNLRADQGDLLIWLDQKPFIDSRFALYTGNNGDDLVALHLRARDSLRTRRQARAFSGRSEIWKDVFSQYGITRLLPRLSGNAPDYETFLSLRPPDWTMTKFGSMTASIYRIDQREKHAELDQYLNKHRLNLVKQAFEEEVDAHPIRTAWPQPPTTYQSMLSSPRHVRPVAGQKALHLARYLQQFQDPRTGAIQVSLGHAAATAHLAIRQANQALAENPESSAAFQVLGSMYSYLNDVESSIAGGGNYQATRRYRQAIAAYNQAVLIEPERAGVYYGLAQIYARNQKFDLALQSLRKFDDVTEFESDQSDLIQASQTRLLESQSRLQKEVESRLQQIDVEIGKGTTDAFRLAQFANNQGCVLRAIEELEKDRSSIAENPNIQLYYAVLLHEAGRVQEAADLLFGLEGIAGEVQLPPGWQKPAAWARLANGDYDSATRLWTDWYNSMVTLQIQPLLLPMAIAGPGLKWSPFQVQGVASAIGIMRKELAQTQFDIGLSQLEAGQLEAAATSFHKAARLDPSSGNQRVADFYHFQLKGEHIDLPLPLDRMPLDPGDTFTPDEKTAPTAE